MAAFIILHQAVFLLACVFLNEFAVFPIILQRPAEVTREYIDAYFAAPDAPEVILYGLQFFELASWAAFVLWALGNIVPWRELAPKEKPSRIVVSPTSQRTAATPKSEQPTTKSPITAPPRNPMRNAGRIPLSAPSAQRALESAATITPIFPAMAESTAPAR